MNIQDIMTLFDYNYWANRRILSTAGKLSQEQFVAPFAHAYGGVRRTLVHILDAEYGWRMILQQGLITPDLDENDFPDLNVLELRMAEEETTMRSFLAVFKDEDMAGPVRYTTSTGIKRERVLWHCLLHVVNHGTQHRSEAATLLTGFGHSPGDLDFTVFLNERA